MLGSRVRHRRAQNSASFLFCPSGNGLVLSYGGHPTRGVRIPCPVPPCRHAHANRAHLSAPRAPVCIHAHTQPRPQAAGDAVHERTHSLWHSLGHQEHLTAALVRTPRGRSCFANRGCNGSPQTEKQILLRAVCMACEVSIETKEKKAAHFAVFVSRYSLLLMTENCSAPTKTRELPCMAGSRAGGPVPSGAARGRGPSPCAQPQLASCREERQGSGTDRWPCFIQKGREGRCNLVISPEQTICEM